MYVKRLPIYWFLPNILLKKKSFISGRILYELADTFVSLQNRRYQTGRLGPEEMISVLDGSAEAASEAANCLRWEDEDSFEGFVRASAERLEKEVTGFAKQLRDISAEKN